MVSHKLKITLDCILASERIIDKRYIYVYECRAIKFLIIPIFKFMYRSELVGIKTKEYYLYYRKAKYLWGRIKNAKDSGIVRRKKLKINIERLTILTRLALKIRANRLVRSRRRILGRRKGAITRGYCGK
jgi:hypothetical protein